MLCILLHFAENFEMVQPSHLPLLHSYNWERSRLLTIGRHEWATHLWLRSKNFYPWNNHLFGHSVICFINTALFFFSIEIPKNLLENISRVLQYLNCRALSQYSAIYYKISPNTLKTQVCCFIGNLYNSVCVNV